MEKLSSSMSLKDLVVKGETCLSLQIMENWLRARKKDRITVNQFTNTFSGFRAVFTGPVGAGKAFAASVLGKETGYEVYRIDLLSLVSKYIGETEKNLKSIFAKAEVLDVILFFDEADALFGKRNNVKDSADRYARIETIRLFQKIESYKGILILAFNKPLNVDSPFFKRFNLVVEFKQPDSSQRLKIWRKYLPMEVQQEMGFEVDEIARTYKLTGGEIFGTIRAARENKLNRFSKTLLLRELQLKSK